MATTGSCQNVTAWTMLVVLELGQEMMIIPNPTNNLVHTTIHSAHQTQSPLILLDNALKKLVESLGRVEVISRRPAVTAYETIRCSNNNGILCGL